MVYSSAVSEVSEGRGSGYGVWGEWGRVSVCSGRARMKTRYGWCQGHMLFPLSFFPSSRSPFPTPSLVSDSAHTTTSLSSSSRFIGVIPSVTKEVAWS